MVNGAQKVATSVTNGAQKAIGNIAEKQTERFVEQKIASLGNKLKRSLPQPTTVHLPPPTKKEKIDINKLIDGAGIVLDRSDAQPILS